MSGVVAVVTVRMASERRPGKVMADVCGRPLLAHVVDRYRACRTVTDVVVATTRGKEDLPIVAWCRNAGVPCHRGETDDVVARMDGAVRAFAPDAGFVMRGMGDMPLVEPTFVDRAVETMRRHGAECFFWYLPADRLPVYGAREWPWSAAAWGRIVAHSGGDEREHAGAFLDRNREKFLRVYHEPPSELWFRPYRFEVDTDLDLALVRRVYERLWTGGGIVPVREAILLLDREPWLAEVNRDVREKTGPLVTYGEELRREWYAQMLGQPVVRWDDTSYPAAVPEGARAVYCDAGRCYLGYVEAAGGGNRLRRPDGTLVGEADLPCACGAGRTWWRDARAARKGTVAD